MTLVSSYRKANNHEDGPFRKVVAVVATHERYGDVVRVDGTRAEGSPIVAYRERLECGHQGDYLGWRTDPHGSAPWEDVPYRVQWCSKVKRRCLACSSPLGEQKPGT